MRYPIMTIYDKNDIEITATVENNTPDFFSGKVVTGIVLYVEQWNPKANDFSAASFLIKNNDFEILKIKYFYQSELDYILDRLKPILDDIKEYIKEQENEGEYTNAQTL